MKIILISTPDKSSSEIPTIVSLFKNGLETLHVRKSRFSTKKLREYLDMIPKEYHNRIIIHSHHKLIFRYNLKGIHFTRKHLKKKLKCYSKMVLYRLRRRRLVITRSFHHIESLQKNRIRYRYVFLNPFFSKSDVMKNHFDISNEHLKKVIASSKYPIYASGNIENENIQLLKDFPLSGIAISGIIWNDPGKAVANFKKLEEYFS